MHQSVLGPRGGKPGRGWGLDLSSLPRGEELDMRHHYAYYGYDDLNNDHLQDQSKSLLQVFKMLTIIDHQLFKQDFDFSGYK